ncbi:MAG: hypothetical protein L0K86_17165 [Actinomycetia bacterium]|nr:hypothetical protein [Actinomycetes bacterium]
MSAGAADHDLVALLAGAHGWSAEETAARHHALDHPPTPGSPEWIEQQAEMFLSLAAAQRRSDQMDRWLNPE